jgi:hypothetical protein
MYYDVQVKVVCGYQQTGWYSLNVPGMTLHQAGEFTKRLQEMGIACRVVEAHTH